LIFPPAVVSFLAEKQFVPAGPY